MSISVLITLTAGTGGNTGPTFNLFSDVDGYVTAFETGVTKTNLVAGYTSSVVPDGSTIIRCKSVGTCTNYTDFTISGAPVPSPTPTPTASPVPISYDYYTADVFPCSNCSASIDTILVAFTAGSVVTLNRFYIPIGGPDTNSYRVVATAVGPGPAFILTTSYGSFGTCTLACGV